MSDNKIKLWSIQHPSVLESIETNGSYRNYRIAEQDWRDAYGFMSTMMCVQYDIQPTFPLQNPIWAWWRYSGTKKPRPDLRSTGFAERGTPLVLLELEVGRERVVLSDFVIWHNFLNKRPITSEREGVTTTHSPHVLFDLERAREITEATEEEQAVQACLWQLRLEDVKGVTHFKAR
jgi:hypothetical protein